jgi:hypothetical protein
MQAFGDKYALEKNEGDSKYDRVTSFLFWDRKRKKGEEQWVRMIHGVSIKN